MDSKMIKTLSNKALLNEYYEVKNRILGVLEGIIGQNNRENLLEKHFSLRTHKNRNIYENRVILTI